MEFNMKSEIKREFEMERLKMRTKFKLMINSPCVFRSFIVNICVLYLSFLIYFRVIEGGSSFRFGNVVELCLVSDVVIPPKFKVPEFEKYKGASCPKKHLTMYCRKMVAHASDEKLLVHFC